MGQFSMEKPVAPGSALSGNQHPRKAPRFVPDPKTLRFLLNSAYFDIVAEYVFPLSQSESEDTPPNGVNRMFLVCRAARGLNACHLYQPPFGLKQYDDRRDLPPRNWSERLVV
jgi:hypothetical protein